MLLSFSHEIAKVVRHSELSGLNKDSKHIRGRERLDAVTKTTAAERCKIKTDDICRTPWCHEAPPLSRRYHSVSYLLTASTVPRLTNPVAKTVSVHVFDTASSHTYLGTEPFGSGHSLEVVLAVKKNVNGLYPSCLRLWPVGAYTAK